MQKSNQIAYRIFADGVPVAWAAGDGESGQFPYNELAITIRGLVRLGHTVRIQKEVECSPVGEVYWGVSSTDQMMVWEEEGGLA